MILRILMIILIRIIYKSINSLIDSLILMINLIILNAKQINKVFKLINAHSPLKIIIDKFNQRKALIINLTK